MRFELRDQTWSRPDGEAVDTAAMEQLVQALASLRVTGLAEEDESLESAAESLRLTATVSGADEAVRITVLQNPEVERFYLISDRFEPTFGTSAFDAERLIDAAKAAAGIAAD